MQNFWKETNVKAAEKSNKIKKYKWWETPFSDAKGFYKINPALIGGIISLTVVLILTMILPL